MSMSLILPPGVICEEADLRHPAPPLLFEEEAVVATAGPERRHEFAWGRGCAHIALARLGVAEAPILQGARRQPLWPPGYVGSVTHCVNYCAAAVAHAADILTIGIDAESHAPLPQEIVSSVCTPEELRRLPGEQDIAWETVIFSAKEAIYKAVSVVTGEWLEFRDVEVVLHPGDGRFCGTTPLAQKSTPLVERLAGRFLITPTAINAVATLGANG